MVSSSIAVSNEIFPLNHLSRVQFVSFIKMIASLILFTVVLSLFYTYIVWNNRYWKKRAMPHVPPSFFYGNTPNVLLQKRNSYYDIQDVYT